MDEVVEEEDEPPRARQILRHSHLLSDKTMRLTFSDQGHLIGIVEVEEGDATRGEMRRVLRNHLDFAKEKHAVLFAVMLCTLLQLALTLLFL